MVKHTLREIKQKDGTFIIPADTTTLSLANKSMGGADALGVAGARRLAFALKEGWMVNRGEDGAPITAIDMAHNSIGVEGCKKFFEALPGGRAGGLIELDVSGNDIGPEEGSKALNFALRKESCGVKLTKLVLSRNSLRDEGLLLLANTFKQNACPKLQKLLLTRNLIEDEGATLLAQSLPGLPCLTALHMNANAIGDAGAAALAQAIQKTHPTLQHLLLTDNRIGDSGASAFAAALQKDGLTHLTELGLGKNHISPVGCSALCRALVSGGGKKLAVLSLEDNDAISPAQIANLNDCLKLTPKLRTGFKPMAGGHGGADGGAAAGIPQNLLLAGLGLLILLVLMLLFK